MTSSQQPGWYHADGDPPGTHRYWDGSTWIGEPQPMAPASPASGGGGGTLPAHVPGRLAEPWMRIVARLIDAVILVIFFVILAGPILDDDMIGTDQTPSAGVLIGSLLISAAWEIGFVAALGGTPGKLLLGLRVADQETGSIPPSLRDAVMRWLPSLVGLVPFLGSLASLAILILSVVWLFSHPQRQTVYDRVATTFVVKIN